MSDVLEFIASTPGVPSYQSEHAEWGDPTLNLEPESPGDDEQSVEFFTDLWPDAGADVVERFAESEHPEWDLLAEHTVSSLMTRQLVTLTPDTTMRDAARHMLARGVHRVLVVRGGKLEGIVSSTDMVRACAEEDSTVR